MQRRQSADRRSICIVKLACPWTDQWYQSVLAAQGTPDWARKLPEREHTAGGRRSDSTKALLAPTSAESSATEHSQLSSTSGVGRVPQLISPHMCAGGYRQGGCATERTWQRVPGSPSRLRPSRLARPAWHGPRARSINPERNATEGCSTGAAPGGWLAGVAQRGSSRQRAKTGAKLSMKREKFILRSAGFPLELFWT